MDISGTSRVVALIALGDRRHVDDETLLFWHDVIGDLDEADALQAVRDHRKASTEYLMPAHIRQRVRDTQRARLAAAGPVLPDVDPDDVAAYQARRRELVAQVASGRISPTQIGA